MNVRCDSGDAFVGKKFRLSFGSLLQAPVFSSWHWMCGCTLWGLISVFISALIMWWSCTDCTITTQSFQCPEISSTLIGQVTLLCVLGVSLQWFPLHFLLRFIIIHEQTTFVYEQHDWSLSFLWVLCEGGMSRMWILSVQEFYPCQH